MGISSGVGDVIAPVSYGFRNVIINGNFSINQRGFASNLASGAYGFDRWKSTFTNTALTFTAAPQGQLVTISSGGSIEQVVERANVPAGSYVLSWSGTARGRVYNAGATPPAYAASPVFVTLDGTANVEVEFAPASGTATLGEVQLERGQRQTPFEFRPIGVELQLCQRYFQWVPADGNHNFGSVYGNIYGDPLPHFGGLRNVSTATGVLSPTSARTRTGQVQIFPTNAFVTPSIVYIGAANYEYVFNGRSDTVASSASIEIDNEL